MKNDILCGRNCLRKEVMVTKEVQVGVRVMLVRFRAEMVGLPYKEASK